MLGTPLRSDDDNDRDDHQNQRQLHHHQLVVSPYHDCACHCTQVYDIHGHERPNKVIDTEGDSSDTKLPRVSS